MKKKIFMVFIAVFAFFPFIGVHAEDTIELNMEKFMDAYTAGEGIKVGHVTFHMEGESPWFELDAGNYTLTENVIHADVYFSGGTSTLNMSTYGLGSIETRNGAKLNINGTLGGSRKKLTAKSGTVINVNGGHNRHVNANGGNITLNEVIVGVEGTEPYAILVENSGEVDIVDAIVEGSIGVFGGKLHVDKVEVEAAGTTENPATRAIVVGDLGEVEILDGTFGGVEAGLVAGSYDGSNVKSIVIKGGTFTSLYTGLDINYSEVDSIEISGGRFRGTEDTAIKLRGGTVDNFTNILADSYTYFVRDTNSFEVTPLSESDFVYLRENDVRVVKPYKIIANLNGGTLIDPSEPLYVFIPPSVSVDNPWTKTIEDTGRVNPPAGKVFSHFEIDGVKYSVGDTYTIDNTKDVTIKWIWKDISSSSILETNPKTGDNLFMFISLLGLSLLGIGGAGIYIKKKILN